MALASSVAGLTVEAAARLHKKPDHQSNDQRQCGHDFKVDERFAADASYFLHVFHAGNARHHGAKNDQRNDHGDQAYESVAERLHRYRRGWTEISQKQRCSDCKKHLGCRVGVERFLASDGRGHRRGRERGVDGNLPPSQKSPQTWSYNQLPGERMALTRSPRNSAARAPSTTR